jgi:hypothetical protein
VDEVDDLVIVDEALQNALSIHVVTSPPAPPSDGPRRAEPELRE